MRPPRPAALSFGFIVLCAALVTYAYVRCKRASRMQPKNGRCYSSDMLKLYHGAAKPLKSLKNGFIATIEFPEPFISSDYLTFISGDILIDYEQFVHEKKLDMVSFTAQGCLYYHDPQIYSFIQTDLYILSLDSVQRDTSDRRSLLCAGAFSTTSNTDDFMQSIEVKIFRATVSYHENGSALPLPRVEVVSTFVLCLDASTVKGTKICHCFEFSSNIISGMVVDCKDSMWYIWGDTVNRIMTDAISITTPPDRISFIPLDMKTCFFSLKHSTPGARVYWIYRDLKCKSLEISSTSTNIEIALFPNMQNENMILAVYLDKKDQMTGLISLQSKKLKIGDDCIEVIIDDGGNSNICYKTEEIGAPCDHTLGRLCDKGDSIPLYVLFYNHIILKLNVVSFKFTRGMDGEWNWDSSFKIVYTESDFILSMQPPPKLNISLEPDGHSICVFANGKVLTIPSFATCPDFYHISRQANPSEKWQCGEVFFPINDLAAFSIVRHRNSQFLRVLVSDEVHYNTVGL